MCCVVEMSTVQVIFPCKSQQFDTFTASVVWDVLCVSFCFVCVCVCVHACMCAFVCVCVCMHARTWGYIFSFTLFFCLMFGDMFCNTDLHL